ANATRAPGAAEASTVTGADGSYAFTGLAAGLPGYASYAVRAVPPAGWSQTTSNPATIDLGVANIGGVEVGQVYTADASLTSYTDARVVVQPSLAIGNFQACTISGTVFNDITGNGFSANAAQLGSPDVT